jgi:two-component system LytT family response regulator
MEHPNLAFKVGKSLKFIAQNEIMYCMADGNYTDITLFDHSTVPTYKSLKELENILDREYFVRVHNKYIINLNYVTSYNDINNNKLTLKDGTEVTMSRRKKIEFLARFHRL